MPFQTLSLIPDGHSVHPLYSCIAPLRLLLLRDSHPDFYDRFRFLMDHNEDRMNWDRELWDKGRENVNRFLREDCGLADR